MRIFKLKRRFIKKLLRACITLFMSVSIVCCSVVAPAVSMPVKAEASAVLVGKIATYILSALGAVNIGTGGRVSKVAGSKFDGLVEMVSDAMGQGVYTDSQGNYVFSNEFSQNVLSYLDGQSSISYRVISDYTAPSDWSGIWEHSTYVPVEVTQAFPEFKSKFDKYLIVSYYNDNLQNSYTLKSSGLLVYDISNVAYIAVNNPGSSGTYKYFSFYDSNSNIIYPEIYYIGGTYYSNQFQSGSVKHSDNNGGSQYLNYCGAGRNYSGTWFDWYSVELKTSTFASQFTAIPYFTMPQNGGNSTGYVEFYSNRSLIFADSPSNAVLALNKDSGVFINNYYTNIPSVAPNVVENNNWDTIYSNYVTNVTNNYYEDNGEDNSFDQTKLRKWMSKYSEQIIEAIQNGDENIAEQLNYTNEWLKKIYNRLGVIEGLISNSNSGSGAVVSGGSSSWSDNDVSTLLGDVNNIRSLLSDNNTYLYSLQRRIDTTNDTLSGASAILNSINSNTYNTVTQLQSLYTLLSNVYNAILNISSGGGGSGGGNVVPVPDSDPYDDWFDVLHNIDELDLDNVISKWDVVKSLIQDSLPFVMLTLISVTLTNFVAQPQDPIFTIPVKLQNNFVDIDETITIDLTLFESILPMVRSMILIFWAVCLILFWLWLLPKLIYIY